MAANLVKEGYPVTGFDVWEPTLERFRQAGGFSAQSPAETVADKDYCVCMVATAQQAQSVLLEGDKPAIDGLKQNAAVLLCSTVPAAYVQSLEEELKARGRSDILLVDCPVSGGAIRAADGTLSIMAGASDAAIDKARELLGVMSDPAKLYIVQGGIGAGSKMKMCHQVLAANQILSASEGMGFANELGLDLDEASQAVLKSEGWSWMLENRLPRILDANHQPIASALSIIIKDTAIITSEAKRYGFPTPMTSAAEEVYMDGVRRGYGPDDDGGLIRLYTKREEGQDRPVIGKEASVESRTALVISLLKGIHVCSAAEMLIFAHHLGLDLNQVYELCTNAAGGSGMLSAVGPSIINVLRKGRSPDGEQTKEAALSQLSDELRAAVEEAQRRKIPLHLGTTAHKLMRMGLGGSKDIAESLVGVWKESW